MDTDQPPAHPAWKASTPLQLVGLVVFVAGAATSWMAYQAPYLGEVLAAGLFGFLVLTTAAVLVLAIVRPEALYGRRPRD